MYTTFTENKALIDYTLKEREQIIELSKFNAKHFITTNEGTKRGSHITKNQKYLDSVITDLLLSLSISLHLISLTDDYYTKSGITKGLYPDTAKLFQTTTCRIERSIRIAVEHCFNNKNTEFLKAVFDSIFTLSRIS